MGENDRRGYTELLEQAEAGYHGLRLDEAAELYRAAVKGNVTAMKLFMERFDPDYRPRSKAEAQHTVTFEEGLAELLSDDDDDAADDPVGRE